MKRVEFVIFVARKLILSESIVQEWFSGMKKIFYRLNQEKYRAMYAVNIVRSFRGRTSMYAP